MRRDEAFFLGLVVGAAFMLLSVIGVAWLVPA